MLNKKQIKNWIEKNEKIFHTYNFKVYEAFYYAGRANKDFPLLEDNEINDTFWNFCEDEFYFFQNTSENNMELIHHVGSTSSFYVLPKYFYDYVEIISQRSYKAESDYYCRGVNLEDFYNFIQNEEIKNFEELNKYFEESTIFINNLLAFKEEQVDIFKDYLRCAVEDKEEMLQEQEKARQEKLQNYANIKDAINLYIDIITPCDVENYNDKIESMRKTLREVEKWEMVETTSKG